ncbi:DUF2877 domain-containing protein [Afipia massiliensis]|uniref:DUF2877 domain-containing protein n=2 Tax=Afipia massiliensis TaxID=211460 RepID=A0A4U6BUS4_9BRAD|nr:DUF2877 domain-containing protein [Afipia massiliensis]
MIADRIRTLERALQPGRAEIRQVPAIGELGLLAEKVLQVESNGRVVAVFDRSFYAVLGSQWICVGLPHLGSGPLHVLCERRPQCWPMVGAVVAVTGSILVIDNKPFATFDGASIWKPELAPGWTRAGLRIGLVAVDEFWRVGSAEEGLAAAGCAQPPTELTPLVAAAAAGIAALGRVIIDALHERAPSSADCAELVNLIGLGPGLTPSGDDLIGGALIALAALDLLNVRDLIWDVCREHLDRTNDISRVHLRTAALGYGAAAMHAAVHATMTGEVGRVERALAAVSAIGHSSGRDGFAGVLIALRAVERNLSGDKERSSVSIRT